MNKYLLMTAAAVFGTSMSAMAAQPGHATNEIQFLSGNGASYCDGLLFYKSKYPDINIQLGSHLLTGCGETNTEIAGQNHKSSVNLIEGWQGPTTVLYDVSRPIKNGGTWSIWDCQSASSCFEVNSGTYKVGYGGDAKNRPKASAKFAEILAARKSAQR